MRYHSVAADTLLLCVVWQRKSESVHLEQGQRDVLRGHTPSHHDYVQAYYKRCLSERKEVEEPVQTTSNPTNRKLSNKRERVLEHKSKKLRRLTGNKRAAQSLAVAEPSAAAAASHLPPAMRKGDRRPLAALRAPSPLA